MAMLGVGGHWLLSSGSGEQEHAQAEQTAEAILVAAERWQRDNNEGCPTLSVLIDDDALSKEFSGDDPWGSRFRVRCDSERLTVWSPGRDGTPSTADDIAVSHG